MKTIDDIVQVDPVLAEDLRTVVFYGWTRDDDTVFLQSLMLPMPITEDAFDALQSEWLTAVRPHLWKLAS